MSIGQQVPPMWLRLTVLAVCSNQELAVGHYNKMVCCKPPVHMAASTLVSSTATKPGGAWMPGRSISSKIITVYLLSMPVFTHCFCLSLCRFLIVQLWKEAACTFNDFSLNVPVGKEKMLQPARTLQVSMKEAFTKQHEQIISNNLSKAF